MTIGRIARALPAWFATRVVNYCSAIRKAAFLTNLAPAAFWGTWGRTHDAAGNEILVVESGFGAADAKRRAAQIAEKLKIRFRVRPVGKTASIEFFI